jgi:hypothetical protein
MGKKRTLKDADDEIKALRSQLAAAGVAGHEDAEPVLYPRALYKQVTPSAKYPNGYQVRRVADEEAEAQLRSGPDGEGWKDSPEGMAPAVPFGHHE